MSTHLLDERIAAGRAVYARNLGVDPATHVTAARNAGVTEAGLADLMVLLTAYLGQAAASAAMATVLRSALPTHEVDDDR